MYPKTLLIAIAAFTLMTPGAYAFSPAVLNRANLSDDQKIAISAAKELQAEGDAVTATELLVNAGIDDTVLERIRNAYIALQYEYWNETNDGVSLLSNDQQQAYRAAQAANDRDTMDAILDEAGVTDGVAVATDTLRLRDGSIVVDY
jgi:hypothetical protein